MNEQEGIFEVSPPSAELVALAQKRGWPEGLLERMLALRFNRWQIDQALSGAPFPTVDMWVANVTDRERLTSGLAIHEATWEDDERLVDLFSNSSERLGDWDVYVERGPNPFAQQRLQENAHVKILVDRGVGLGVSVQSGRNSLVGGQRLSVGWMGGWRVRNGFRRNGYSTLLLSTPGSSSGVFGMITYWYVRLENGTANSWIAKAMESVEQSTDRSTDKLTATVFHLDAQSAPTSPDQRVRPIEPDDISRCVELINNTHGGLDLFRPYSVDFLETRLHDLFWGPKPPFVPTVYGWPDMAVLEVDGSIVACGGLWDRGRDVRERWRHRESGEERVVDTTCLMDFGYAAGHEGDMAALIGHHLATTKSLGRTTLSVALEFQPDVLHLLSWASPQPEVRSLETMGFASDEVRIDAVIKRPHTDLGYW